MIAWARVQGCDSIAYPGNLDRDEPEDDLFICF
jgi:hypothetical protein